MAGAGCFLANWTAPRCATLHEALGAPGLVALGFREDRPECLVAQAVNEALNDAVQQAEAALLARLGTVTLAALSHDFHARLARHRAAGGQGWHQLQEHSHETR